MTSEAEDAGTASATAGARSPLTRDAIVDEARTLVSSDGLDHLSLRRLAERLGVTAPALYAHIDDKDDILRAIADLGFRDLMSAYAGIDSSDPCERLKSYSRAYVQLAMADPAVFQLMFLYRPREIELPDYDNVLDSATSAFASPLATVTEAIETGAIHPDRDPLMTALVLWTTAHGVATVRMLGMGVDAPTADELTEVVIETTIAGLKSPPA